jgi:poly-gamma-glutamate synthesis protein (capsule biosynthesis protein)|nr:CapA family protein [Butyrivibrio sp.]
MDKYILVAGDFFPTDNNYNLFSSCGIGDLIGDRLQDLISNSSYTIVNLEGAITDGDEYIKKSGPPLRAPMSTAIGIADMGIDGVSLANNHIMDYGVTGFNDTITLLKQKNIDYWGAGNNIYEAKKPMVKEIEGKRIGIYSCAEYEFTIATTDKSGANPFDELEICDDIIKLKEQVDYLIVLYHGMKEFYRYPAPYIQKRCRKLIDKGADIVLCQHSHCIGCMEEYQNGQILYGQGNFLFCYSQDEISQAGLVAQINLDSFEVNYIPVKQDYNRIRMMEGAEADKIIKEFKSRSEEIKQDGFIYSNYRDLASNYLAYYEDQSLGKFSKILRKLHLSKIIGKFFNTNDRLSILNDLRCEAHRDLYIKALEEKIYY